MSLNASQNVLGKEGMIAFKSKRSSTKLGDEKHTPTKRFLILINATKLVKINWKSCRIFLCIEKAGCNETLAAKKFPEWKKIKTFKEIHNSDMQR